MPWETEEAIEIPEDLDLDRLYDLESRKLPLLTADQEVYLGEQMERARQAQEALQKKLSLTEIEIRTLGDGYLPRRRGARLFNSRQSAPGLQCGPPLPRAGPVACPTWCRKAMWA